jgi:hypothetical protein
LLLAVDVLLHYLLNVIELLLLLWLNLFGILSRVAYTRHISIISCLCSFTHTYEVVSHDLLLQKLLGVHGSFSDVIGGQLFGAVGSG